MIKLKLQAKETILSAIKRYPMDLDELKEYFKKQNKEISTNALYVTISRLIKEDLVLRDGDKILYSNLIESQREAILQDLYWKSVRELKSLIVVFKSSMEYLVKNSKIVKKKILLVL